MNRNTFAKMALIGTLLVGGSAAQAAETQADWTTTLNVKLILLQKLGQDSLKVDVDSDAGAVILKGTVNKRETKELAETVAQTVAGVKSVKNDIELAASEANSNKAGVAVGEAEAEVKDALLETQIRLHLIDKLSSGGGFKIGTQAASGVVTLAFDSDFTAAKRTEASQLVQKMDGVKKVITMDKKS